MPTSRPACTRSPRLSLSLPGAVTWPLGFLSLTLLSVGAVGAATDAGAGRALADVITTRLLVVPQTPEPVSEIQLQQLHQRHGARCLHRCTTLGGIEVVPVPKGIDPHRLLAAYQAHPAVAAASFDQVVRPMVEPDDPHYGDGSLWSLHNTGQDAGTVDADIDAPEAWDIRREADAVIIAVVDTGVSYQHRDLQANMWRNPGETGTDATGVDKASNGIDDDGNGYIDDVHGINVARNDGDPFDDIGHGTHLAGTIAAVGDNGLDVTGVVWSTQLMACRFMGFNEDHTGFEGTLAGGLIAWDYAIAHGARVICNSWGADGEPPDTFVAAATAAADAGVILVCAAGNDDKNIDEQPVYPAVLSQTHANVVTVAATDRDDALADFTNTGALSVHLAAPGVDILSLQHIDPEKSDPDQNGDEHTSLQSGTSMAAPHVTAALALIWAEHPTWDHLQVIDRLLATVDPLPNLDGVVGSGGRLNLAAALAPVGLPPSIATTPTLDPSPVTGTSATASVTATDPDGDDAALIADWSVVSAPAGAPTPGFSPDASTLAMTTTVSFGQAGDYLLAVRITDPTGLSVEAELPVTVVQAASILAIEP